jgi:hypothetical protein
MEKKTKPELPDAFLWLQDLPKEAAAERFTTEQMILCEACGRSNAPTRVACLYCGTAMQIAEENAALARPVLRRLENWEKGWSVVYLPVETEDFDEVKLAQTAAFLRLERAEFEKILEANHILPVALAESGSEAAVVENHLQAHGFKAIIVSDEALEINILPNRVRSMEFGDNQLNLYLLGKSEEPVRVLYADIELIIVGGIFERQVENREQRKNENSFEIKDSREISSDESLLDFYVKNDKIGYRISVKNFDFSCLGAEKKMLARENFGILLEKLKQQAENATFDDFYKRLRAALNPVWQPDQRNESLGWQHEGIGKISIDNRMTVNNAAQFLRYSRMLSELRAQKQDL